MFVSLTETNHNFSLTFCRWARNLNECILGSVHGNVKVWKSFKFLFCLFQVYSNVSRQLSRAAFGELQVRLKNTSSTFLKYFMNHTYATNYKWTVSFKNSIFLRQFTRVSLYSDHGTDIQRNQLKHMVGIKNFQSYIPDNFLVVNACYSEDSQFGPWHILQI